MTHTIEENEQRRAVIGIDVSKDKFDACCIDGNGKELFRVSAPMDSTGFDGLAQKIRTHGLIQGNVVAGMESTGCYHLNLFSFLTGMNFQCLIINPLLISNFMKLDLRKTKTDKKDAAVIAQFLRLHRDAVHQLNTSEEIADLRDLARQRESLCRQMSALKNDLKRLLSITFPELEKETNVFSHSVLTVLTLFASAAAVQRASVSQIAKCLSKGALGRKTSITAEQIKHAAKKSVGTTSMAKEFVVSQKASMLLYMGERMQELSDTMNELCASLLQQEIEIMTSVKGIGETTASEFLGEIGGDISKFESAKKVIAFAGLDPSVHQSGKHVGQSKISKRGSRYLRRVIWQMSVKVIRYNETFREYFMKRRQEGLVYRKAVLATAHKLVRVIFSMLMHKAHFCSPHYS
ncbi:MAG: IS110 family transposase [Planctomycetota bacterium]